MYNLWYHLNHESHRMIHAWCKTGRKAIIIVTETLSMMEVR